jgi:APA family basic amino acid/polyamine antiporter
LLVWMLIGFDIYLWYSIKKSHLSSTLPDTPRQANKVVGATGLVLAIVLAAVAFLHHEFSKIPEPESPGNMIYADTALFYFSVIFAALQAVIFGMRISKK